MRGCLVVVCLIGCADRPIDLPEDRALDLSSSDLALDLAAPRDLAQAPDLARPDLARPDLAQPASCAALPANCGASANDSCCDSPLVPGGSFLRNNDQVQYKDTSHPATVSDFRLDKYEITVGRFRAFIDAGQGTQKNPPADGAGAHPHIAMSGWKSSWNDQLVADSDALRAALRCYEPISDLEVWSDQPGANENRPISCISWYEAFAFCAWDGGFLPTNAEWGYAASGGNEQRVYSWSSPPSSLTIDPSYASFWVDDNFQCMGDGIPGCTYADFIFVGTKPKGDARWGQSDLTGNVWEWTLDSVTEDIPNCVDCASLADGHRLVRGGDFSSLSAFNPNELYVAHGGLQLDPLDRSAWGARCARRP